MTKWFISSGDLVRGPFSYSEVVAQIEKGLASSTCLIWGRELSSWVNADEWTKINFTASSSSDNVISINTEWYYASKGQTHGPLHWSDLIQRLRLLGNDAALSLLWKKGMKSWVSVFEFSEILQELELNQRRSDRIELTGHVRIQIGTLEFHGDLESLSTGGFGAQGISGLTSGNQITAVLTSDLWNLPISVKAEVRYLTPSGSVGFKFTSINREDSSQIQSLIRSAKTKKSTLKQAA